MRILFLNPIGELGGAERCLLDFFFELRRLRPSWELNLISGTPGPLLEQAQPLGVRAELLAMPEELAAAGESGSSPSRLLRAWLSARRYAKELRARVDEIKPDALHSNGIKCHLLTRMMRLKSVPVVWHIHDFLSSRRMMSRALRWASPAASLALACSDAAANDARRVLGKVPVRTLLNAVDTARFSPAPGDGAWLDSLAGIPSAREGTLRIGLVATYAWWKGHGLFIEAAARLKREDAKCPVRFFMVGGPIYKTQGSQFTLDELRAEVRRLGLENCFGFVPFQEATENVYRSLDIVVHASTKPEPFGRTIAEAMACGRPVVASLEGGVAELIDDGPDAIGFAPRNADALATALKRLAGDADSRVKLSVAAREKALSRFSLPRMGASLVQAFEGLVPIGVARPS